MASIEVFNRFSIKLLISLPMQDVIFLTALDSRGLFPGDLKDQVKAKAATSSAQAAYHFLNIKIEKDLKIGNNESLFKLLSAMEEFSEELRTLAQDIKRIINDTVLSTSGLEQSAHTTGL